jgi:hypothetical protein
MERGWSQAWMAIELDVGSSRWSQSKVAKVESGQQPLTWQERIEVAAILQIEPARLGATMWDASDVVLDRPPESDFISTLAKAAEIIRSRGGSREAVLLLSSELRQLRARVVGNATQDERRELAEVLLALALAKGDIAIDAALEAETIPLTQEALSVASAIRPRPDDLWWRALHRHGNELRKAQRHRLAERFLCAALEAAPRQDMRLTSLIPLTRAQFQTGDRAGLAERLRELHDALDDPSLWTASFHPVAVLDTELRGAVIFDVSPRRRSRRLRELVGEGGVVPEPGSMAPQWHSIWAVSVCADALTRGQLDLAEEAARHAAQLARQEGLDRQLVRLERILAAVDGRAGTKTLTELREAARIVTATSA